MTAAAASPGTEPEVGDGDLDAIRKVIEVEAVKADPAALDDTFAALAALLLDFRTARENDQISPDSSAPTRATSRPDARRQRRPTPSRAGTNAA